jgi:membrane-associated phospholipid phosphatase
MNPHLKIAFIISLAVFNLNVAPADAILPNSNTPDNSGIQVVVRGPDLTGSFLSDPSQTKRPSRKCWIYPAVIAFGAGIFAFDKSFNNFSQKEYFHGTTADDFFHPIGRFGPEGPFVVTAPLLAGYGLFFKDKYYLRTSIELATGFGAAEILTGAVKLSAGRKRPYQSDDPYQFFKGCRSFWSGHTISAFTYATIMSKRFPRQNLSLIGIDREFPLIPVLTYSFAIAAGIQRLYDNDHWASDVYFGALAGYGIGSLTVHLSNKIQTGRFHLRMGEPFYLLYDYSFNF